MIRLFLVAALVAFPFLSGCDAASPGDAASVAASASATPPVTEAPDLVSVTGFVPVTQAGVAYTLVTYTFDQPAYLNGGDRSNFHLVPLDASDAVDGTGIVPDTDIEGDTVVEVFFNGTLTATAFARGYLDTGVANSDCCNTGAANPANINQSAIVSNGGLTDNPDLIRVTQNGKKTALFEFDEPLTDDDVVQSTSGLRVFFPATAQSGTIRNAGAVKVKRISATTLEAKFKDLPEGYTLAEAVGAYVVQGAVQAAVGSRGGNDGKNAFDEVPFGL